jgi:predicted metal-dependent HD superfamily phosphohydrolase
MTSPAEKRWLEFWQRLGGKSAPQAHFAALQAHYTEAHRAYHNLGHVLDCLEQFETVRHLAHDTNAVEMAIWYHDVIYDPRAKDNEERSASVAAKVIEEIGWSKSFKETVTQLILATKKHDITQARDADVLADVDLSILGREPRQFDEYERQIRREYDWVSEEDFAAGRTAVLEGFLARPVIFTTESFRERYEWQARENLKRSIQTLRIGGSG